MTKQHSNLANKDVGLILTAIHDLTVVFQADIKPETLAHLAQEAIRSFLPDVDLAVWWLETNGASLIAGNPPTALRTLPSIEPEQLCLLMVGQPIRPSFFAYTEPCFWQFVPITDRIHLYGWIGINFPEWEAQAGLLQFLCTVGAILGQTVQRQNAENERLRTRHREALLSRYLSPAIIEAVLTEAELERCAENATVLCLDLRNFTSRVYAQNHGQLLREMNSYFEKIVDIVFQNSGVVDKLLGDGLIAEFGILEQEPAFPASRALQTAFSILERTEDFNINEKPLIPFKVNIGIATGSVHIGHMGGKGFFDLTVLGIPINLAARLEHEASLLAVDIAIDTATMAALSQQDNWHHFPSRSIRGLPKPIDVWGMNLSEKQTGSNQ
jgi:class 3 adenylate cyclase